MKDFDQVDKVASCQEAINRFICGEQYRTSTSVMGETTYGYGILDELGYFQHPLFFKE